MITDPVLIKEWHVVARADSLRQDEVRSVSVLGEDLVLWRNRNGVMVWQDLCIHRGAKLSRGKVLDGCLQCPYHGWRYDHTGHCVEIPAHPKQVPPPRARTRAYTCRESSGWIWVTFSDAPVSLPEFPEWNEADRRLMHFGPFAVAASGPRIIENFLDVAHLSIAHGGILGDLAHAEVPRYEVTSSDSGVETGEIVIWQPNATGSGEGCHAHYRYRVMRPLTAYFDSHRVVEALPGCLNEGEDSNRFTMMITATPLTETSCHAWFVVSLRGADHVSDEAISSWTHNIFMQDVPIVESQKPERLPLDLQAELHLNCDRTSIAYRQWLRKLGLTFGTA